MIILKIGISQFIMFFSFKLFYHYILSKEFQYQDDQLIHLYVPTELNFKLCSKQLMESYTLELLKQKQKLQNQK